MEMIGKSPINPVVFYTGKVSAFITWAALVYSLLTMSFREIQEHLFLYIPAFLLFIAGVIITVISVPVLGRSLRMGLPTADTELKTAGIYRISRNPMYVAFGFFTLASVAITMNLVIVFLGTYSLITHHLIIRGEERFLHSRFGADYDNYRKKVRRYL